jgi:hypothetical protein
MSLTFTKSQFFLAGAGSGWLPDFTMDVLSCMIPPEPAIAKIARLGCTKMDILMQRNLKL